VGFWGFGEQYGNGFLQLRIANKASNQKPLPIQNASEINYPINWLRGVSKERKTEQ